MTGELLMDEILGVAFTLVMCAVIYGWIKKEK